MGFFEKVKNMFTEEVEEDDVKVEQIKSDVTKVTIDSPVYKTEEEVKEIKKEDKISTPIFFDDNDFRDLKLTQKPKEEIKEVKKIKEEKVKEIYGSKIQEPVIEKKNFKPTPIISPVYGILDKNYTKDDIVSRDDVKRVDKEPKESSIDTIRNKAYGTLEDELENTLFGSNSILFKKDEEKEKVEIKEVNDEILTDLTDDISKELDELLIKKEKYIDDIEDEVESEKADINDDDLLDFIDSTLYKDGDEE